MGDKTFEIRLYPNKEQQKLLDMTFGACRFVYNNILSIRQTYYKNFEIKTYELNIEQMLKAFNPWLKNIEAKAIQCAERDLDKAYSNWYNSLSHKTKQNANAPTFKKKSDKQSYRTDQMRKNLYKLLDLSNRKITIPKIGKITYRSGYNFDEIKVNKICNITLKKSKTNKYFCCICCECNEPEYIKPIYKETAFDLGLKDFAIFDDGTVVENPRFLRKTQEKLAKEQRKLSHCKKDSKNYEKQRLMV